MDGATLSKAMNNALPLARYKALTPGANEAMRLAGCTNRNRAAMFLAQLGHESVGLKYTEEIHDGSNYEGRPDLGNVKPGDGKRFKGRSFIQITGRHNYTMLSAWAHAKKLVPTPTYFVDNPAKLGTDQYAWLGAVWYWTIARPRLNELSDARDLLGATRAINGGLNGLEDRRFRWNLCLNLGQAILPGKDIDVTPQECEQMIANAFRAYHQGGKHGRWDPKKYPGWIKDKAHGIGDRVFNLEKKVKP